MEGRVLIVDDDASMAQMLAGALQRQGLQAVFRTSPEEALALVESEPFDCVITDLNMKGMSGVDLCGKIVGQRPDLPVIVLTSSEEPGDVARARDLGVSDYIVKPAAYGKLLDIVRGLADKF